MQIEDLELIYLVILATISLKGNEYACFLNNGDSFKVNDIVHNFRKKLSRSAPFIMVHVCKKKSQQDS